MPATNDATYVVLKAASTGYAQTGANLGIALDGSTPFSVDAWIQLNGLPDDGAILSQEGTFSFGVINDCLSLQIVGYPQVLSDPTQQALDEVLWHHVCATYDGGSVRMYIDGEFNCMQSIVGAGTTGTNPFRMAAGLQALCDTVRVFHGALDAATVLANMYNDPAPASVVAWFDFTQAPPVDRGAGKLPITLAPGATMILTTPSVGLVGTAYAKPLSEEQVNPGGNQVDAYTVLGWVYLGQSYNPQQTVFINSDLESDTGMALSLQWDGSVEGFRVLSQRGANFTSNVLTSQGAVPLGQWTHVATTFDGTTLAIYLNGALDTSGTFGPIPLVRETSDLLIGAALSQGQPYGASALQGYVSRVDVYARALGAQEIAQSMAGPPDVEDAGLVASYDFTSIPARNQVSGHGIGLVDGALMTSQDTPTTSALARPAPILACDPDEAALIAAANLPAGLGARHLVVTRHRLGDDHVLLGHDRRGTWLVYRGPAADYDDCTVWKVQLVFVAVAGVFDAVFGVRCTLSQRAMNYIVNRVLLNPRIMVVLGFGTLSAPGLFSILVELNKSGDLSQLAKMLLTIGFWALLRVLAKIVLTFLGLGAADLLASLALTVAAVAATLAQRPASCDVLPGLDLAGIKFNYDPTAATSTDALTIRKNASTAASIPEWTKGMTDPLASRAAYSIAAVTGKSITIQAKFTVGTTDAVTAQIQASGGGALGAIAPFTVNFVNGVSVPEWVTISLPAQTLGAGGVQVQSIRWSWQYSKNGGPWIAIADTAHRIYAVLQAPTMPWKQTATATDTQLPWSDMLEYACNWANGATDEVTAATAITQKVNGAIGLRYDTSGGAAAYTGSTAVDEVFFGTQFLDLLGGGGGLGKVVNCTDCATIVSTFANLVGCNLTQSRMWDMKYGFIGFYTNKMIAIGGTAPNWSYPFPTQPPPGNQIFAYHEVAWTSALAVDSPIYDACLQVDSSSNPWDWSAGATHTPLLPTNLQFSTRGSPPAVPITPPFTDASYRERLAANTARGIGCCTPKGPKPLTQNGRRRVI